MRYFLTIIKSLIKSLVILFILLGVLFLFLLTTTPGLFITTQLAKITLPGKLTIEKPQGRLIDDFLLPTSIIKACNWCLIAKILT